MQDEDKTRTRFPVEPGELRKFSVDHSADSVYWIDEDARLVDANETVCRILDYSREELLDLTAGDIGPSFTMEAWRKDWEQLKGERRRTREWIHRTRGGREIPVEITENYIEYDGMALNCVHAHDITRRRKAELDRQEEIDRRRILFEQSRDGIVVLDQDGSVCEANRKYADMLGYTMEEVLRLHIWDWDAQWSREVLLEKLRVVGAAGEHFETRHRRKDGAIIDAEISTNGAEWRGRKLIYCICRDVSDRKASEEALRESEEKYRKLLGDASDAILLADAETGMILEANHQATSLTGWSVDELKEMHQTELHPLEARQTYAAMFKGHLSKPDEPMEALVRHRDGGNIPVEITASRFKLAGRSVVQGIFRDVTERVRAEQTLRESEKKFRTIFQSNPDPIVIVSLSDGRSLDANDAYLRFAGLSREEAVGSNGSGLALWHDEDEKEVFRSVLMNVGTVRDFEASLQTGQGIRTVLISGDIIAIGDCPCMLVLFKDITERKSAEQEKSKLESQLRQAQKLEAVGTLAGGIAHDFNNILSPIIGYTEMALDDITETSPSRYDLKQVLVAANRAKELVRQILSFSRFGEQQFKRPVDISPIVKEALKLLRASLPSSIEIRQSINKVMALADATQIHQVIVNLCTNAAHAMEDRGILDVSLKKVVLGACDGGAMPLSDLKPGPYLKLSVSDTGQGMDAKTLERIFDPYFTTKEAGKGTGLGLAVVHGIVKSHGGEVQVRSTVGIGSVFDVYIPTAGEALKQESDPSRVPPGGAERILFIDDEPVIAQLGARMLGQLGYAVTAKSSPRDALDLFKSNPGGFDLIITDYTMPHMVGTDLAGHIMKLRPDIPVIVCTGFSERITEDTARRVGIKGFAMKPLDRVEFAQLIRSVLDTRMQ